MPDSALRFPYMRYARSAARDAEFWLSQSGMPAPQPSLLGAPQHFDLDFAGDKALPTFRRKVAEHVGCSPEALVITVGATGAMHLCALAYLFGARAVSETPSYEPLRALPKWFARVAQPAERRPENQWSIDPDEVERIFAAQTAKDDAGRALPGHMFITNPNNPTGTVMGPEHMQSLGRAAAKAGGNLIVCEIYMEFLAPEQRFRVADLCPNGVSIGSLTKAYGMGGLRLGWIQLGEEVMHERKRIEDALYLMNVDPPTPALSAGIAALDHIDELHACVGKFTDTTRPMMREWIEATAGVTAQVPDDGIICFPHFEGVADTRAFADYLNETHKLATVPGEFFGRAGHLRLGFGQPADSVRKGLERLTQGLQAWRKQH